MIRSFLFFLALVFTASLARAEFSEGSKSLTPLLGFSAGGIAVGLDFEYAHDRTYGLGGYFRMYPEDDETGKENNGYTAFGGFIRPHFNRQAWDFYVSPGFGFLSVEPGVDGLDDETLLGPSLSIGLLYEVSPTMSIGFDHMNLYGWFGENDYRGHVYEEILAQLRLIF
jgi:hypothetical protein